MYIFEQCVLMISSLSFENYVLCRVWMEVLRKDGSL